MNKPAVTCYIGIGANLNDPKNQVLRAIEAIRAIPKVNHVSASSLYGSQPMGPQDQPDYINAVVAVETTLSPHDLLHACQHIEQEHGRVRKAERWGPRALDLDMILYGNQVIETEELTVPHYGMKVRSFVLYPLAEIAPDLTLPDKTALSDLLEQVPTSDLTTLG
ncbi:2-amino-4-hydroxy-6-hydroxymethyldihydropteridine diphosphokinase [Algicola sagamiensis]|uniref:2-amino-4-hydroxy-6- hydroxymethyldihydropteridine diphosphokinase n=1 Tax=Algicola sagamiensis TaxID=163869 RepID=UPI000379F493|nr:2-amino-4-hydroxy-6-hydroxymethyldihydropteridine diphosphokinase [Algicola sagamiensis]